jgi:hypothetical protein
LAQQHTRGAGNLAIATTPDLFRTLAEEG